jgi:GntR family transcriptional regulator
LAARNLLVRKQGSGTYISTQGPQESQVSSAGSFADLVLLTHGLPLRDVTVERDVPLPPRVRRLLATENERGTVMRRIREIDGTVFAYTLQYIAPAFDGISDPEQWKRLGLLKLLHNQGVVFSRADQSMSAKIADVEVAEQLEVGLGAPVLYAERVLHSDRGPVEVVCAWYRADLFVWHTTLAVRQVEDKIILSASSEWDEPVEAINVGDPSSPSDP